MQLEDILKELNLTQHTAKFSVFRDELLTESAVALQAAKLDADAKIKDAADKAAEEITGVNEALAASGKALADAKATADTLKDQLESGKAVLAEHQKISDDLANRAEKALAEGDLAALPEIIADAKTFGAAREKKKLLEEAKALEKQADDLEDKAAELKAKAEAISVN